MMFAVSLLIGALLGMRFSVFVLFPVIGLGLAAVAILGVVHGDNLAFTVLAMVGVATALQVGYVAGSAAVFVAKSRRLRQTSTLLRAPEDQGRQDLA